MDDPVRSPGPVSALGGFAGRAPADNSRRQTGPEGGAEACPRAVDRVSIHAAAAIAGRLLRERVLASTRALLELDESQAGPEFAEVVEDEPAGALLGRLLSAQNQLAARRAAEWEERRVRRCLDRALQEGAAETLDLLAEDGRDDAAGAGFVAEVLAEYGRRLAALAAESDEGQQN